MNTVALAHGSTPTEAADLKRVLADVSTRASGWYATAVGLQVALVVASGTPTAAVTHSIDEAPRLAVQRDWMSMQVFTPRTELGKRLWALRKQIVSEGYPLLDSEGVGRELSERRGERIQ